MEKTSLIRTFALTLTLCLASGLTIRADVPPHPRLFADAREFAALNERLNKSELGKIGRKRLLTLAEQHLKSKPCVHQLDESKRRILHVSRHALEIISIEALAYRLTDDMRYARRAIDEIVNVASFKDWNPPHFLDTAEMSLAVAIGYDWLYDQMTPAERTKAVDALLFKGISSDGGKTPRGGWWEKTACNWGQVCHAGMTAGAIAVAEIKPNLTRQILDRTVRLLPCSMSAFAPDGCFPEGASGYWQYALEFNAVALAALEKYDGTDHGLCNLPGFREQAEFPDFCTGPTGFLFNFSDGDTMPRRVSDPACWWFARRFDRTDTLVFKEAAAFRTQSLKGDNRLLFFTILNMVELPAETKVKTPLCRKFSGMNPIAVMRTSWSDPEAWYVAIKGGTPSANHGHMDIGSFVFDAKGVRWSCDLGGEGYARIEKTGFDLWGMKQDGERWTIFRYGTDGHSTYQIGRERQLVKCQAKFLRQKTDFPAETVLDMTGVYAGAGVSTRTFRMEQDGGLEITDSVSGLQPGEVLTWRMNTRARIILDGPRATLIQKDAAGLERRLEAVCSGVDAVFEDVSVEKPRIFVDRPNPGLHQLTVCVRADANGNVKLNVSFR